jgi:predicted DNA-binding transcriptional regulator AlpA
VKITLRNIGDNFFAPIFRDNGRKTPNSSHHVQTMGAIKMSDTDCHLMTSKQVRAVLGNCSDMHIWRLENDQRYADLEFPQHLKIGRRNFYRAHEISAWIEEQAAKTPAKVKARGAAAVKVA